MSFMTEEQFAELWNERGLCYRFGDFYQVLLGHGLKLPFPNFLSNMEVLLRGSLVEEVVAKKPHETSPERVRWWNRHMRGESHDRGLR